MGSNVHASNPIKMGDRRQVERSTVEEITQAKPGFIVEVQSALPAQLQARFGAEAQQAVSEHKPLNPRLKALVADAIDARFKGGRHIHGKVRTGEEIARAIPDVEVFLAEIDLMQEGTFFELNDKGQLVMQDGCAEVYGLGENALQARIRQTRKVYKEEDGQIRVMSGEEFFKVTRKDEGGIPRAMETSYDAKKIAPSSILMERDLPTFNYREHDILLHSGYVGEYARMVRDKTKRYANTWVGDETPHSPQPRYACWVVYGWGVETRVGASDWQYDRIGSRGVLRVNLNFES